MPRYEYKVVPAPTKGLKARGVKGAEARFSHAIQELMNGLAGYGWEYQRAETLPSIERSGLTSTTTEWRNVLVFRRLRDNDAEAFAPELLPPPENVAEPAESPPRMSPKRRQNRRSLSRKKRLKGPLMRHRPHLKHRMKRCLMGPEISGTMASKTPAMSRASALR